MLGSLAADAPVRRFMISRRFLLGWLLSVWGATIPGCGGSGVYTSEVQPSLASIPTKPFVRKGFKFEYPASWTVDEKDEDFDPDHKINIDASKKAFVGFVIVEPEKSELFSKYVKIFESKMPAATKTEFDQWGKYKGTGTSLQGKFSNGTTYSIRIFAFNDSNKTFLINETMPDSEKAELTAGFRIVEESFELVK
jgi:hypothetical protein